MNQPSSANSEGERRAGFTRAAFVLARACLLAAALGSAGGVFAAVWWPGELMANFRWPFGCLAGGAALLAIAAQWRPGAGFGLVLAFALGLTSTLPLGGANPSVDGPTVRVGVANILGSNPEIGGMIDWARDQDLEVLAILELNEQHARALDEIPDWPHRAMLPEPGNFGMGLISAHPIVAWDVHRGIGSPATIEAQLIVDGRSVRVLAVHPMPPVSPEWRERRDRTLLDMSELVDPDTVVLGDLNATRHAPILRRVAQESGLHGAPGRRATWPAFVGPLGLELDHILVGGSLGIEDVNAGPAIGSDHRPVAATVRLP